LQLSSDMPRELRTLQANLRKWKDAQYALQNDTEMGYFNFIVRQEPNYLRSEGHIMPEANPRWVTFTPTGRRLKQFTRNHSI